MVTIITPNAKFNGTRVGIQFRQGQATVAELSEAQVAAFHKWGYTIEGLQNASETPEESGQGEPEKKPEESGQGSSPTSDASQPSKDEPATKEPKSSSKKSA